MADIVFWFVAFITVFSAGMVVTSKSLLYSAYSLLFTFLGVTGLYIFLWADFLAVGSSRCLHRRHISIDNFWNYVNKQNYLCQY